MTVSINNTTYADLDFGLAGRTSVGGVRATKIADKNGKVADHPYWAFRPANENASGFGFTIAPLAAALPTSVSIDGVDFTLEVGLTPSSHTDRKTGVVTSKVQRNRVSGSGTAHFPSIGEPKRWQVSISETSAQQWNVKVVVTSATSSTSPEDRAVAAAAKAAANAAKFGF